MYKKRIFLYLGSFLLLYFFEILGIIPIRSYAIAQNTKDEIEQEISIKNRFGFNFSIRGIAADVDNLFFSLDDIYSPEDDIMPYPISFFNMRYNAYEATVSWDDDQNENIFRFSIRYNHYGKNMYVYGGPVFWRWNKEFNFIRDFCGEYSIQSAPLSPQCVEGTEMSVELETDRPNGKSIWIGISSGLGVEYKLLGLIWSHEIEVYFTPCKYEDFICAGGDIKFWGIHFPF